MENLTICPEDTLRVLLPARQIPDQAQVTKRTGEQVLILRRNLTVYHQRGDTKPLVIDGYFLISDRGQVQQIAEDRHLLWIVDAETFVDTLKRSWEPTPQ